MQITIAIACLVCVCVCVYVAKTNQIWSKNHKYRMVRRFRFTHSPLPFSRFRMIVCWCFELFYHFFILWRDFFFTSYIFAMALLRLVTQCFVCYNLKEEHTHTNTHTSIFELIDLLNKYTRSRLPITIRFDRIEVIV